MAVSRSFTDYVRKKYDNEFWTAAEQFIEDNQDYIKKLATRVHSVGETEIADVHVEHVWVEDLPGMKISFDVALSVNIEIKDGNHHYDVSEERTFWLMVSCWGDLDKKLKDFEITSVSSYNGKNRVKDPMDDSLCQSFLILNLKGLQRIFKEKFPRSTESSTKGSISCVGRSDKIGRSTDLTIQSHRIKDDSSVFGQIYFEEADADIYDEDAEKDVLTHIKGKPFL